MAETNRNKIAELEAARQNPNVQKILYAIREAEGTQNQPNQGANTLVGYGQFQGYGDHPRKVVNVRKGLNSSAAGSYQIIQKTWDGLQKEYGFSDFSPRNQELAAIALIKRRGALNDVEAGNWNKAIPKLNREWASFPGDVYGQGGKSMKQMLAYLDAEPQISSATTDVIPAAAVQAPVITADAIPMPAAAQPISDASVFEEAFQTPAPENIFPNIGVSEEVLGALGMMPFQNAQGARQFALPISEDEKSLTEKFQEYDEQLRGKLFALNDTLSASEEANQQRSGLLGSQYPNVFDTRLLDLIDRV